MLSSLVIDLLNWRHITLAYELVEAVTAKLQINIVSVMDTAVSDMLSMYREIFLQVKEVKLLAAIIADTFV